jgi:hypothetical protein
VPPSAPVKGGGVIEEGPPYLCPIPLGGIFTRREKKDRETSPSDPLGGSAPRGAGPALFRPLIPFGDPPFSPPNTPLGQGGRSPFPNG